MTLHSYKPVTPSLRFKVRVKNSALSKNRPFKGLTINQKSTGGRDNHGHISSRHRGSKVKQLYRIINFKKKIIDVVANVVSIEYDPNRTANIALIKYVTGEHEYMIAPDKLMIGQSVITSENAQIEIGNTLPVNKIPVGTFVHNVELKPGGGAVVGRSAGVYVQIAGKELGMCLIKLPSSEMRKIDGNCYATIGIVSNLLHQNESIGKAGTNRLKGFRPHVRGVAMNPVDHPLGGGEGKSSGGRHPVSPWGQAAKGLKTRRNKRSNKFIVTRRKKK